jgi:folate-dependent tRNA-U54 methylase TrmFO/GidA
MAKKKGNGLFAEASRLRDKHPKKFKDWKDYVSWASELQGGKGKAKKAAPAKKRKAARKVAGPAAAAKPARTMGTVSYHLSQAKKQLQEQLAWLLLARDQERRIRERNKLNKKVVALRAKLRNVS